MKIEIQKKWREQELMFVLFNTFPWFNFLDKHLF